MAAATWSVPRVAVYGVIDFDGALFRDLWQARSEKDFRAYVRYYMSDHRPLWAEFNI